MVDLGENSDLIEDLVCGLGVAKLGTLDGDDSTIIKCALVYLSKATGA